MFYEEELSRRDVQHANELKSLKKELRDADTQHLSLNKEIMMLKDKLEKTRRERYSTGVKNPLILKNVHIEKEKICGVFFVISAVEEIFLYRNN